VAVERLPQIKEVYPEATLKPALEIPARYAKQIWARESALIEIIRGRLESSGPVTANELAITAGLPVSQIEMALLALENEGFIFRGQFTPESTVQEWCERRLLSRIHRYTLQRLRKEIEAVSSADFMRFLFSWQGLDQKPEGISSLEEVLKQLEGFEAPAAAWEGDILPARVADYEHTWLDLLCLSGKTVWGRFRIKNGNGKKSVNPVKTTPIMLISRSNKEMWQTLKEKVEMDEFNFSHEAMKVYKFLLERGACFFDEIVEKTKLFKVQTEDAIGELVASGLLTSDSYTGLRSLLVPSKYRLNGSRRTVAFTMEQAGRWSLLGDGSPGEESNEDDYIEMVARLLLKRYGVVFRKIAEQENISPPWRDLVRYYRRMEARGEVRGGRFVDGVWGEQFALSEAVAKIRSVKKEEIKGTLVCISAADPLNLQGVITPGKRIPSYLGNRILYRDGIPVAAYESEEVNFFISVDSSEKWELQNALIRRNVSPKLRPYLGKGIV
jgi:ATP-dependent Lhr-like helicase